MASKRIYESKIYAAGMYAAGIWRGLGVAVTVWTPPSNCPITANVTMPSNAVSGDVTITETTNAWNVTMPTNSVTGDVGIGCGYQT